MKLFMGILAAACGLLAPLHAAQIVLNQNAIVNPGAELGQGSASGNDVFAIPGWVTTGNFTAVQYGAPAAPVASGGAAFGANFFSGGPNNGTNSATQVLDVSNLAQSIDAGLISYILSGYFGGYLFQNDNATLLATFLNSNNLAVGTSSTIGGFNSTSRNNISQLLFDSANSFIPVGTRSVQFTLTMTREEGFYNDGYADNLAFLANLESGPSNQSGAAPEPSTFALGSLSLGFLLAMRKLRNN